MHLRVSPASVQMSLTSMWGSRLLSAISTQLNCGNGEFQRYLNITTGSASELEHHFLLARDLGDLSETDYPKLEASVVEMEEDRRAG